MSFPGMSRMPARDNVLWGGGTMRRFAIRIPLAAFALALAFALGPNVASAALFDDEVARKRIEDTNIRLGETERRLDSRLLVLEQQLKSGGLLDLASQIELIKSDIAKLRGQIEVLAHELGEAQKRQRDLYVDLDSRFRKIETAEAAKAAAATAPPPAPPPAPAIPPPDPNAMPPVSGSLPAPSVPPGMAPPGAVPGTVPQSSLPAVVPPIGMARPSDPMAEQRTYDAALDLFKRGDYTGSITAFGNFIRSYPRTPLSSSAQYWVGNAHFARRDFRSAITAQRTLIANYPDSTKVPDAMLNIASAQGELGDMPGARRTLEDLVARYPTSEAAVKARQRTPPR